MGMEKGKEDDSVICAKCGFSNSPELKFCGNCGARLSRPTAGQMLQSLSLLLIATSLYLVVSILVNGILQASILFLTGYLVSALLGMYAGYRILQERSGRGLVVTAAASISVGFVFSFTLFLVELGAGGKDFVGPVWIFFALMGWVLLKARREM